MGTGSIEVTEATVVDDDLVGAMARLVPQLSSSGSPPDAEALEAIVASDSVALLVAVFDTADFFSKPGLYTPVY